MKKMFKNKLELANAIYELEQKILKDENPTANELELMLVFPQDSHTARACEILINDGYDLNDATETGKYSILNGKYHN